MAKKKKEAEVEEIKTEEVTEEVAEEVAEKAEEQPADERDEKIAALEKEVADWKDKYMRLAAEYDNYRKRTANEKLSIYDDATGKAVKELLPVADSVRMALENLKDADGEIVKGVELIRNQLGKSFDKLKITTYGEVGETFDPQLHNAVSMVDSDELESGQIAAVFQTGFKVGDKIIRHAMVQVVN